MISFEDIERRIAQELPTEFAAGRVSFTREERVNPYRMAGHYECGDVLVDGHRAGWWWDNREDPLSSSLLPWPAVAISAFYCCGE